MLIPSETFDLPAVGGTFEQWRGTTWRKNWMTSPEDRAALIYLLRSIGAETVAEIGINEGYTARCLLDNVSSIKKYFGIEVIDQYVRGSREHVPKSVAGVAQADNRLCLLVRKRGSLDVSPDELGPLDAMIIDGDHDYDVAKADTNLARQTVRSGGLIIWHDYHEGSTEGVRDLLEDLYRQGMKMKHVAHTWLAFLRIED